ncbi:hypothetical protein HNR05_000947 [Leifsonia psychrotolerans]|uniref:Uncharacterized protein n=1 Tax=Glaciibacter psychrotolerans TaxID=670054 RepID=A0A7Z0ECZ8_9MICO|nr:hypothetical protein [Leifsonia psychrotolerans]
MTPATIRFVYLTMWVLAGVIALQIIAAVGRL